MGSIKSTAVLMILISLTFNYGESAYPFQMHMPGGFAPFSPFPPPPMPFGESFRGGGGGSPSASSSPSYYDSPYSMMGVDKMGMGGYSYYKPQHHNQYSHSPHPPHSPSTPSYRMPFSTFPGSRKGYGYEMSPSHDEHRSHSPSAAGYHAAYEYSETPSGQRYYQPPHSQFSPPQPSYSGWKPKPKKVIKKQPVIHREHVHVHNIHKHHVHHHKVHKEHIHIPVYHNHEKHEHKQSEGHKHTHKVQEYTKHMKPQVVETHKWVKPVYAGEGWKSSSDKKSVTVPAPVNLKATTTTQ